MNLNTEPRYGMFLTVLDAVTTYWLTVDMYSLHHEKDDIMLSISGQKMKNNKNGHKFLRAIAPQRIIAAPFRNEKSFSIVPPVFSQKTANCVILTLYRLTGLSVSTKEGL